MKFLVAVIRPEKLDEVVGALAEAEIPHMTVSECRGIGTMERTAEVYRGVEYAGNYRAKVKLEVALSSEEWLQKAIGIIKSICYTGSPTDGIFFVTEMVYAENIGTGKTGSEAL